MIGYVQSLLGVLILYHIGMYYVADWGWHIKSDTTYVWLQDVMVLTNPWRMSLLFFISAVALSLVLKRYHAQDLLLIRSKRLLIPLIFGMFTIVAPQVYVEALSQQLIEPGFLSFWSQYINPKTTLLTKHHSPIGLLTWNHLWFLPYLWLYSAIVIVLHPILLDIANAKWFSNISARSFVILTMTSIVLSWYFLRESYPPSNALVGDWYNHAKYFGAFILGYFFPRHIIWWSKLIEKRRLFLMLAVTSYMFILLDRHGMFASLAEMYKTNDVVKILYGYLFSMNHWGFMFAVVGYAGYWLNRPSPVLRYLNEAILPYYILHQTLIVVFAWWLKPYLFHPIIEFPLLLVSTLAGCAIGFEIVKRVQIFRWLFGLKRSGESDSIKYAFSNSK
ncbi:acyltransferase family protein (plasmid) [Pseudoalteromonas xiamenensis]|uniref:acyltransferase family protein n=1 Tax=Pseudoalteromonas xiamenensis TaxID=882626 RepID=UPI0027E5B349|nr:acyltransferase family protein [Pseudoalteromonas xiamenensis]WMN61543.1 acyltransferase family protein [Pseudoalteromonas xiamenensis]